MHRSAALALSLALVAVGSSGCKKQPQQPDREGRTEVAVAPVDPRLPPAHKLSREPEAGVYVAAPAQLLAVAHSYVPAAPSLAILGEFVLGTQGPADWAKATSALLDGQRAWSGAHVAGEDILQLPLRSGGGKQAAELLARYPKAGEFGAVELPRAALAIQQGELVQNAAAGPKRLAMIDGDTLTIAGTPAGLATGRELARTYGERPLWFTLADTRGKQLIDRFPYGRVSGVGEGLHSLDIVAAARTGQKVPTLRDLAPGALGGALQGKSIAAGASTRWTGYKDAVREASHEMQVAVDRAGFAGKMMLDPIADQATRVMKQWNGRVLVAVGPARHIRVGLGADDPHAAHRGLLTLLRDIIDNLQLARMFVSNIPNANLKKIGEEPDLWLLTVSGITNNLPPELRTLADDGKLRVAFNGHAHAGALLVVIGPRAEAELKAWVSEASAAPSGKDGMKDLASVNVAVSPESVAALLQQGSTQKLLGALLGLSAERAPTRVVMQQNGERYEISVRGPEMAPRQ